MGNQHECSCSCSTNFLQTDLVAEGWRCPVCKRILSPWTSICPCNGQGIPAQWTTTTTTTGETQTITLHNNGDIKTPHINTYFNQKEDENNE